MQRMARRAAMERNLFQAAYLRDVLAYRRLQSPNRPNVVFGTATITLSPKEGGPPVLMRANTLMADWARFWSPNDPRPPEIYFKETGYFLARRRFPHPRLTVVRPLPIRPHKG